MDSTDKMYTLSWAMVAGAFTALVFLTSSCAINNSNNNAKIKIECVRAGKQVGVINPGGPNSEVTCLAK